MNEIVEGLKVAEKIIDLLKSEHMQPLWEMLVLLSS